MPGRGSRRTPRPGIHDCSHPPLLLSFSSHQAKPEKSVIMGLFSKRPERESTGAQVRRTSAILMRYLRLTVEDLRLTAAEKLTVLFSTVTYFALLLIVGTVALVFVSIGLGHWLAATVAPLMAYLYIALFYVLVLVALVVFKRQLLIDPICRFVTRLIVEPPCPENDQTISEDETDI